MSVNFLIAQRVEEILPMLVEAARGVSPVEKQMAPVIAERM